MPWPEGTPSWLRNQWGVLSGGVSARLTTAQITDSLRSSAAAAPGGWGRQGVIYVSQLRSVAARIRNAAEAIIRSGFTGPVRAEHVAEAPWSRSMVQQQLAPKYLIRGLVQYTNPEFVAGVPGVPDTLETWVSAHAKLMPGTLDEIVAAMVAQRMNTGTPPTPVTGVSRIEILTE